MCYLPQQIVGVGEALQQQTEHVADGRHSRLGQRGVSQGQQQSGDQLKLSQQFGIFGCLAVRDKHRGSTSQHEKLTDTFWMQRSF